MKTNSKCSIEETALAVLESIGLAHFDLLRMDYRGRAVVTYRTAKVTPATLSKRVNDTGLAVCVGYGLDCETGEQTLRFHVLRDVHAT